jgi:hypothetical protein
MTKRSPKKRYNEEITLIQPCHEKIQKKGKSTNREDLDLGQVILGPKAIPRHIIFVSMLAQNLNFNSNLEANTT